jgi:hypothetical protein
MPGDPTGTGGEGGSASVDAGDGGGGAQGDAMSALPWKMMPVAGTFCRDGTGTGYGLNVNPASNKLLIWFEGGGACFNELSCVQNPETFPPTDAYLNSILSHYWIMDRNAGNNPFRDWNLVFIPYCSGDVHSGTSMNGYMGQPQVGFLNFQKDLAEIVPQLPGLDQVVLGGISAGGFGVAWNWMWTQDAFKSVPVDALDDSGPPMGPDYLSECQQQRIGALWGWTGSLHPSCTSCNVSAGKVVRPLVDTTMKRNTPSTRFGLLSYDEDSTIKQFFGFGIDDCAQWDLTTPPIYPFGKYPAGLTDLRASWAPHPQAAMYEYTGNNHTFLSADIASVKTGSISMLDWIKKFINKADGWTNVVP